MNYLAIDYGTRKIGLAGNVGTIALPLSIIATKDIFKSLPPIVGERKIDTIIIGIANHMDGRTSEQSERTREFVKKLSSILPKTMPIVEWDERLTSFEAKNSLLQAGAKNRRETIDDMAASILLQSYLDSVKI